MRLAPSEKSSNSRKGRSRDGLAAEDLEAERCGRKEMDIVDVYVRVFSF